MYKMYIENQKAPIVYTIGGQLYIVFIIFLVCSYALTTLAA